MHNCTRCSSLNNQVSQLRQAAIDAAVELDLTRNGADLIPEHGERIRRIIMRIFMSCEALDAANGGKVAA